MVKQVKITFEKGGEFFATLKEEKAPRICKQVWEALPIEDRIGQTSRSGQVLYCVAPFMTRINENPKIVIPQGGLALDAILYESLFWEEGMPIVNGEIYIAYGDDNMFFGYSGLLNPCSYFAQIKEDLEELYEIGLRNREYGREGVIFSKVGN